MRFWMSLNGVCLLVSEMLTATLALGLMVYALRVALGEGDAVWRLLAFGFSLPFGLALCAIFASKRDSRDERE